MLGVHTRARAHTHTHTHTHTQTHTHKHGVLGVGMVPVFLVTVMCDVLFIYSLRSNEITGSEMHCNQLEGVKTDCEIL